MRKGLTDKEIKEILEYSYFDDDIALSFLGRVTKEEVCGTYRLYDQIPLYNARERKVAEDLGIAFAHWIYDHKYALGMMTDYKITYTNTNGLDTYRFH